jgi:hypothetical protein
MTNYTDEAWDSGALGQSAAHTKKVVLTKERKQEILAKISPYRDPMVMNAYPQIKKDTILSIIKTAANTFRVLVDGSVHPLLVGFATIEEAVIVRSILGIHFGLNSLMTQSIAFQAVKDDILTMDPEKMVAARLQFDADTREKCSRYQDLMLLALSEEAQLRVWRWRSHPYMVGWPTIVQDASEFLRCEGRNALPGE